MPGVCRSKTVDVVWRFYFRLCTKVIFDNGKEIRFTERMGKKEAIRQAGEMAKLTGGYNGQKRI